MLRTRACPERRLEKSSRLRPATQRETVSDSDPSTARSPDYGKAGRRWFQPLKKSEKQIPRGLNFAPTSAKTALVGDPCSPARDDKIKDLNGAPKGAPLQKRYCNALEVQVRQDLRADAELQLPRCRPLHLNGGLFPCHRHAINSQRGGRDRAAEFQVVADLRDVEEHVFQVAGDGDLFHRVSQFAVLDQ